MWQIKTDNLSPQTFCLYLKKGRELEKKIRVKYNFVINLKLSVYLTIAL